MHLKDSSIKFSTDEPIKKPQKELQAVGVGTKARPRFHGAFTGGFSAGYFNTVGSKDGTVVQDFDGVLICGI